MNLATSNEIIMLSSPFIIAIDGLAASGKGTLTLGLSRHLNIPFLDTGAIYRKLGYLVLKNDVSLDSEVGIAEVAQSREFLELFAQHHVEFNLHTPEISDAASRIGVFPKVREILNASQRDFPKGKVAAIIDGRDIGTIIFPDADIKLFITADVEIRSERRYKQLISDKKNVLYEKVLADLKERDLRDSKRECSPTIPAPDAIVIDTSHLDVQSVLNLAIAICERKVCSRIKVA